MLAPDVTLLWQVNDDWWDRLSLAEPSVRKLTLTLESQDLSPTELDQLEARGFVVLAIPDRLEKASPTELVEFLQTTLGELSMESGVSQMLESHPTPPALARNVQVIDNSPSCMYDVYALTEDEFNMLFVAGTDVAFLDDVYAREDPARLHELFSQVLSRRLPKRDVQGIHGTLFFEMPHKRTLYPTLRDEEARDPEGAELR
jgi:hypothetical protein